MPPTGGLRRRGPDWFCVRCHRFRVNIRTHKHLTSATILPDGDDLRIDGPEGPIRLQRASGQINATFEGHTLKSWIDKKHLPSPISELAARTQSNKSLKYLPVNFDFLSGQPKRPSGPLTLRHRYSALPTYQVHKIEVNGPAGMILPVNISKQRHRPNHFDWET